MKKKMISIIMLSVVLITGIYIGYLQVSPPNAPKEGSADYQSVQTMFRNIEEMTQKPHPICTPELEEVRTLLLTKIREMGYEPIIEEEFYGVEELVEMNLDWWTGTREELAEQIRQRAPLDENGNIRLVNILVKIDAPGTEKGVMYVAHYDSDKKAPGAGDDMTGVCAILEAMRDQAQKTAANDLYFLFTDGEEVGTKGAHYFVKRHPELAHQVELVINYEGMGGYGGVLMFETPDNNYNLVQHYIKASTPSPFRFFQIFISTCSCKETRT